MSDSIIKVENLGKRYRIHHQRPTERYSTLRDTLASSFSQLLRRKAAARDLPSEKEDFWALKDVSFDVKQGEVVGMIGRNGAGKSTILKILSRITQPTKGRVILRGRVASLLEVGTGFHPELTGRENIFLNGAILGMTKAEIRGKFSEIVGFAGIEKFLDTPVKRYSSGMYVRLAFAVAAYLEPEILVIDEVLAVGDSEFQRKCLGRMRDVAQSGRTVLFVSHNMNAVENLCTRAILLEKGCVRQDSEKVRDVITQYLGGGVNQGTESSWTNDDNSLDHHVLQPTYFAIVTENNKPLVAPVRNDEPLHVVIRARARELDRTLNIGFALFNQDSEQMLWSLTTDGPEDEWPLLEPGDIELRCAIPQRLLNEGVYRIELICSLHNRDWFVRPGQNSPAVYFEIQGGLSDSPYWLTARPGLLAPVWKWEKTS